MQPLRDLLCSYGPNSSAQQPHRAADLLLSMMACCLNLQTHRTDGREKGPVVAGQQKGDTTWVGRTDQLLLQNERKRTCLAEIALAGQTRGQSGREPNIQLVTYPGAPNASCVESDGLFAAASLSTWQRHAGWDVRPGVDVTCRRRAVPRELGGCRRMQRELGGWQLAVGGLIPFTKRDCS